MLGASGQNRVKGPMHIGQLIFDKGAIVIQWEKKSLFNKWVTIYSNRK